MGMIVLISIIFSKRVCVDYTRVLTRRHPCPFVVTTTPDINVQIKKRERERDGLVIHETFPSCVRVVLKRLFTPFGI